MPVLARFSSEFLPVNFTEHWLPRLCRLVQSAARSRKLLDTFRPLRQGGLNRRRSSSASISDSIPYRYAAELALKNGSCLTAAFVYVFGARMNSFVMLLLLAVFCLLCATWSSTETCASTPLGDLSSGNEFGTTGNELPTGQITGDAGQFFCRTWSVMMAMYGQIIGNTQYRSPDRLQPPRHRSTDRPRRDSHRSTA